MEDTAKTASPSTSSFFTLRKRLQPPLPDSGGSSATESLLYQLAVNIQEGWLTREGVLRTLESLMAERPGESESDRYAEAHVAE